jgi:hypothetical protein
MAPPWLSTRRRCTGHRLATNRFSGLPPSLQVLHLRQARKPLLDEVADAASRGAAIGYGDLGRRGGGDSPSDIVRVPVSRIEGVELARSASSTSPIVRLVPPQIKRERAFLGTSRRATPSRRPPRHPSNRCPQRSTRIRTCPVLRTGGRARHPRVTADRVSSVHARSAGSA